MSRFSGTTGTGGVNDAKLKSTRHVVPGTGWNESYQSGVREAISRLQNHPWNTLGHRQSHEIPNLEGDLDSGAFLTRLQLVVRRDHCRRDNQKSKKSKASEKPLHRETFLPKVVSLRRKRNARRNGRSLLGRIQLTRRIVRTFGCTEK